MMDSDGSMSQLQTKTGETVEQIKDCLQSFQDLVESADVIFAQKIFEAKTEASKILAAAESQAQEIKDAAEDYRKKLVEDRELLEGEKLKWEEEKETMAKKQRFEPQIKLDVGGHTFTTTLTTLTRIPDSVLGAMFSGRHTLEKNEAGAYFIDRDGTNFRHILNFLRAPENFNRSMLSQTELMQLRREAAYYQLEDIMFPPYPENQEFFDEVGNRVKLTLSQSSKKWCLGLFQTIYSSSPSSEIIVCCNCKRGYCNISGRNSPLSLLDFDDGKRDITNQTKVRKCDFCK